MIYPDDFIDKVICGDCLEVMKDIPDNSVDLVLTDPPYNVSTSDIHKGGGKYLKQNFGDWDKDFKPQDFVNETERILSPNGQVYIFCSDGLIGEYCELFNSLFKFFKLLVIWRSNPCPQFRKRTFVQNQQYIVWTRRGNYTFNFLGQNEMHACFQYMFNDEKTIHPNQKDIDVISKLLAISSSENDIILDPFLGSGTTAVACKQLNRHFIGIEINPDYCKIARERLMGVPESLFKEIHD